MRAVFVYTYASSAKQSVYVLQHWLVILGRFFTHLGSTPDSAMNDLTTCLAH